jgi:phospholipase/lecithinase/hemolysin
MSLPFVLVPARRLALALTFGASLAVLASCGGSVSRVSTFQPTRMVSFGDEVSAVGTGGTSTDGLKYSINSFKIDATTGVAAVPNVTDCSLAPVWNQVLAQSFGFVFAQCNPNAVPAASLTADLVAVPGATVADVEVQVATYRTTKGFDSKVLVTIMAGLADVKSAYTDIYVAGGRSATALALATAQAQSAGIRLGNLVNSITAEGQGGRVIYATTPDLGFSPYAIKEEAAPGGAGSRQVLTDLTAAFNSQLRLTVTNDGRYAGLVAADEVIQVMAKNPVSFALSNVTLGGCLTTATLPNCDQNTLITATAADGSTVATTPSAHLWADDTHPANNWHGRVGSAADSRARNNPF